MKTPAAIYLEREKAMVIDDIDFPEPGPTHVVIKQFATGVCHSQLHELRKPAPTFPLVLGHESTGVVVATGSAVTHVQTGDHVMVTWVQRGASATLPTPVPAAVTYKGNLINFGSPVFTGVFTWAETTIVDQQFVVPLPKDVATDVTSIIGCAVMTGCGAAINAAMVRPGNPVAIIGAGGVGLSVIQACANIGAYPIITVDLTDEKLKFAEQFGSTIGVNATKDDAVEKVRELTNGGVEFAFDAIGVGQTIEQALEMARPRMPGEREGGTAILVGVPHGEAPNVPMRLIFLGKVYRGAPGGSSHPDNDFPMYVRWLKEGKLPLDLMVTQRFKLDEINEACTALGNGEVAGRAIVEFSN